jgi:heptosyltransferase-2
LPAEAPPGAKVGRLVVLAPNWLGDAIMALPLLADLRRAWTETAIIVAARTAVAPLFSMVPDVDEIVTLDRASGARHLAAARADAALLLPNSFASAWLARKAGIAERWGYARDLRGVLLTKAIRRPRSYGHQVEYYQALGRAIGVACGPPLAAIQVSPSARESAALLLREHGVAGQQACVVFAPGAAYGRAKQWPASRFAELARRLAADAVTVVLVGAAKDRAACDEVSRGATTINLAGRTDLPTLAGVMASARAVVSNDSGAMHLAAACGVPVAAIFGPTNERRTSPLRAAAQSPVPMVLASDVWCRPCMLRECPIDHRCMTRISAARVHESVRLALS